MGKRELVLIALFLVAGVVVYQVTAPPSPPGTDVSVGGIFQRIRRQMQGARENASAESRQTVRVDAAVQMVRINIPRPSDLTITGTDRNDIGIEIKASSRGYTQADAKNAAEAATVKADTKGDALVLTGAWEDHRGPAGYVTQVRVTIALPRRLAVNLLPHLGPLTVSGAARFECLSSRGDTKVTDTAGDVLINQTSGTLQVSGGTSLKLTSRNSRGEIAKIAGLTRIDATGSHLRIADVTGPLEIEARNTDLTVENIDTLKPPLRYNGQGGELRVAGLRTEARIDGRNTDLNVTLAAAAPVTIYNLGAIVVTAPPGGYTIDAVATEGRITSDDSDITATPSEGPDARVTAKIRGGGPTLNLRSTRGRIELRRPASGAVK
jgi:hypothetical protein